MSKTSGHQTIILYMGGDYDFLYDKTHSYSESENMLTLAECNKPFKFETYQAYNAESIEAALKDVRQLAIMFPKRTIICTSFDKIQVKSSNTAGEARVRFRVNSCRVVPTMKALESYKKTEKELTEIEKEGKGTFTNLTKIVEKLN